MAQRMACIVLVKIHNRMGRPPIDTVASAVHAGRVVDLSVKGIKKTVGTMIDWGHRYGNIEVVLGKGICLALGSDLSESQSVGPIYTKELR